MNSSVNTSPMPESFARQRRAMSLVELMVVIAIVVTLAAVTLPSVREMLKSQKSSQAARQVQAYFEAAKSKAIASGRPVGVLLDRLSYAGTNNNLITNSTCLRLSMVEVLPPYCGDIQGATAELTHLSGTYPNYANAALLPVTTCPTAASIVTIGDFIAFGDNPTQLEITAVQPNINVSGNFYTRLVLQNPTQAQIESIWPLTAMMNLPFRIYRKPGKALTGGIDLPRGTCIDLTASGVGTMGRNFSPDIIAADPTWGSVAPANYRGIYIVFDPNGSVQRIYQGGVGTLTLTSYLPKSTIHLLLGKTDQVVPPTLLTPFDGSVIQPGSDLAKSNLMDSESIWLSINPFTGAVYSSDVVEPVIPANPALFTTDFRTRQAREFAIQGVARGGR
jgi:prepilin-type N-terminal cleavage/methylation domain-containing protein